MVSSSISTNSTPAMSAKSRRCSGADRQAEGGVVRAAGVDPRRRRDLEVGARDPERAGHRQLRERRVGVHHVDRVRRPAGSGCRGRSTRGVHRRARARRRRRGGPGRPCRRCRAGGPRAWACPRRSSGRPRACARPAPSRPSGRGGRCSPP